jgi:hypothetical protein
MAYFTDSGPKSGPILSRDGLGVIDVFRTRDERTPIGPASPVGLTAGGVVVWRLTVDDAKVAGRWIVLGGEFLPTK